MIDVIRAHSEAMEIAEKALDQQRFGSHDAVNTFAQAFELERLAAMEFFDKIEIEPTRSILFRSAATLALDCDKLDEAERLCHMGLAGHPPNEIADELRHLLERASFYRHLSLHGLELSADEFQMSLTGNEIGPGFALGDEIVDRLQYTQRMVNRTLARMQGLPFDTGATKPQKSLQDYAVYVSTPREGSFALSIKLGSPKGQRMLDFIELDKPADVLEEVFTCLDAYNRADIRLLEDQIPDTQYRDNFVALARQLAPDGDNITGVGFTYRRNGNERVVAMTDYAKYAANEFVAKKTRTRRPKEEVLRGELRMADSLREANSSIVLLESTGQQHKLLVPSAIMSDIVKPLWQEYVEVVARREKGRLVVESARRLAD